METQAVMHTDEIRIEKACPMCRGTFTPKTSWARFCSSKCRNEYAVEFGSSGTIAGVRKVKGGVNVVVHFDEIASEHAIKLALREAVRVVSQTPFLSRVPRRRDQSGLPESAALPE